MLGGSKLAWTRGHSGSKMRKKVQKYFKQSYPAERLKISKNVDFLCKFKIAFFLPILKHFGGPLFINFLMEGLLKF